MSGSIHVMCTIEGPNPCFGYDPESRKRKIVLERMQRFGVTRDWLSRVQWKRDTNREDEIERSRTAQTALKRTEMTFIVQI